MQYYFLQVNSYVTVSKHMLDWMNGGTRLTTDLILKEYLFLLTGGDLTGFITVEWDKGATLYRFIHL